MRLVRAIKNTFNPIQGIIATHPYFAWVAFVFFGLKTRFE
jgi:hypothetical protein